MAQRAIDVTVGASLRDRDPRDASVPPTAVTTVTNPPRDLARIGYRRWLGTIPEPTAMNADAFFATFVDDLKRHGDAPEGAEADDIRARFMALVEPGLLSDLEQACFLATKLPGATYENARDILERIAGLLEADGSGVKIEAVVETHRLSHDVRALVGRLVEERVAVARGGPGGRCEAPVHDDDPLDAEHYASIILEHWLAYDHPWDPTLDSVQQYFGFFTNTALTCRNPCEGEEMNAVFDALMRLVEPHLADDLGRARNRARRLHRMTVAEGVGHELDQIEMLLETDGLTVSDIVDLEALPPAVSNEVRRRAAALRAGKARLAVQGGAVGVPAADG